MSSIVENKIFLSKLFYCYKELLTPKQVEYFELYFEEDLSLQEIADDKNISKAAVHDALNKIFTTLKEFENKLKINQNQDIIDSVINDYISEHEPKVREILSRLKEIK